MTLDGRILRGLFEHKRLKAVNIRTNQGNVQNLAQLKQIMNAGFKISLKSKGQLTYHLKAMNIRFKF